MDLKEAMGRRYCAFRRDDPDEILDGQPLWVHAVTDIEVSLNVLDTFNIDVPVPAVSATHDQAQQLHLDFSAVPLRLLSGGHR